MDTRPITNPDGDFGPTSKRLADIIAVTAQCFAGLAVALKAAGESAAASMPRLPKHLK